MSPYAGFFLPSYDKFGAAQVRELARTGAPNALILSDFQEPDFESLKVLADLEVLKVNHAPRLRRLDGLAPLKKLREFVLSTPPGWDGTGRSIEVESLAPLEAVPSLEKLILMGVRPADLDVAPIARMKHLKELDIGFAPGFTLAQYASLAAALPGTRGRCLRPYFQIMGVGGCRKCRGQGICLNGTPPRARKWACPKCNAKKIAEHFAQWERAGGPRTLLMPLRLVSVKKHGERKFELVIDVSGRQEVYEAVLRPAPPAPLIELDDALLQKFSFEPDKASRVIEAISCVREGRNRAFPVDLGVVGAWA